jgi:chemotaxis signal transduction protein
VVRPVSVYVRLRVAKESYAMPVAQVIQVARIGDITAVPGAPRSVLGVRNFHGQILPVLDLAQLLGVTRTEPAMYVIVGEAVGQRAGLAIDEVTEVGELAEPTEDTESGLLTGATLAGGDLIGILDMAAIIDAVTGVRP